MSCLMEADAVFETVVVGAEDRDTLVKPKAYVVVRQGYATS